MGAGVGVVVPPLPGVVEVPPVCPVCWAIALETARLTAAIPNIAGQIRITAASCSDGIILPNKSASLGTDPLKTRRPDRVSRDPASNRFQRT